MTNTEYMEVLERTYSEVHATTCNIKRHCEVSGVRDTLNEYFRAHREEADKICINLDPIKAYVVERMENQGHIDEYRKLQSISEDGFPRYRFHSYEMGLGIQAHLGDLHSDPEFLKIIRDALYIS